jgi:transposase
MSNHLKVAMIDLILSLHRKGWSQRRIAIELEINRETVARYLKLAGAAPKPAIAPSGSDSSGSAPKPAIAPPGSSGLEIAASADVPTLSSAIDRSSQARGRPSDCEPWRDVIQSKRNQGLSAQRIFQDLTLEFGFQCSYYTVRRFVRRLEPVQELPFRRLECEPGDEAQVDFGTGAPVTDPDGKRRRTHVFRGN